MERILFDCDNTWGLRLKEIDDGLTLLYLLGRADIEVLGITTTFGNGTIEQVFGSTKSLMAQLDQRDIPLHKGAAGPGQAPTQAAKFLAQTASAHPGEISLLATGPLSNLHAAWQIDPQFFINLKQVVCMGGYLTPLRIGWRDLAELNLSCDPLASLTVLNAPCPLTLMNAHICLQAPFYWQDLSKLSSWSGSARRIVRDWLLAFSLYCGIPRFYLWDLLPALYLSYPDLFDANWVGVVSTLEDLERGMLKTGQHSTRIAPLNMPAAIKDPQHFKGICFQEWQKASL